MKNDQKIVQKTEKRLRDLEAELTLHGYRSPISQFATLEDFIESIGGKAELSAAYQAFLDQLTSFKADENFRLSPAAERQLKKAHIALRPYQRAGIHWLDWLFNNHLHGLLADDMGLGKTLQSISLLHRAYEQTNSRQHSLILTPKSVIHHWKRELERFFPDIRTYEYHGPSRRKDYLQASTPITFISTYETVTNDLDTLKTVPFFYIILDEATRIKNPDSKRAQAVKALNGAHRLALSGTPVENQPAEMWSLFDFLMRGHLGKHGTFQRVFENPITAGDNKAAQKLGRRVKPFMLRRIKEDVANDLPEKIPMDEWCELSPEQRQLYGALQDQAKQIHESLRRGESVNYAANILPLLTKLKQICDHPALITQQNIPLMGRSEKFDWIVDKIGEIVQQREQVVVFSHFLGMLNLLEEALGQKKLSYIRIDGSTNKRQNLIDKFNRREQSVALCSIQATGYGINLIAANHVIHADRRWNPATENQATDRVHRIGQEKTVYVYRIMVRGTLEERIDALLSSKQEIADTIVKAAGEGARQWSREELLELLRPLD
ncbi:MAG: hypothetical protein BroJett015_00250 [Chloroflexota bacterium]|nr:DEAD/DEAH box helicase [Chloroflexota bacterium]GIK54362.1 MAG: hypothetical protein BroJett015_00250 [Chloroflexota bacterium]